MHWNHPCRPQENGVIERSQDLAKAWAEPGECNTVRQFQYRINREDRLQREEYPSINGLPRLIAYPELKHSGKGYSVSREQRYWNWNLVVDHLAGYAVPRKVDSSGKIGLYGGKLYIGIVHKHSQVIVQFDPQRIEWIVSDVQGRQLRIIPATEMTPGNVRNLKISPSWRK